MKGETESSKRWEDITRDINVICLCYSFHISRQVLYHQENTFPI
jgi:hypothetical protein